MPLFYFRVIPPSIVKVVPVTHFDASERKYTIPFAISTPDVYRIYNFSNTRVYEESGDYYSTYPAARDSEELLVLAKNGNYSEAWEVPDYYSNSDYKQFVIYNKNFDDDTSLANIRV